MYTVVHIVYLIAQKVNRAVVLVRDAMQTLNKVSVLFSQSIKCRTRFAHIVSNDDNLGPIKII